VDDAIPPGSTQGGNENWYWDNSNPPPYSGALSHKSSNYMGVRQHFFTQATPFVMPSIGGANWYTYVYLGADRPREIMLQWLVGTSDWGHRAYWGDDLIQSGTNGTPGRMRMGDLPQGEGWVRLEIPLASIGLIGKSITGMAFTRYDGTLTWDKSGVESTQPGFTCPAGSGLQPAGFAGSARVSAPDMSSVDELRTPPEHLFCLFGWCFQIYHE
jgi:hypothetical protein